jgi:hypothetical protein
VRQILKQDQWFSFAVRAGATGKSCKRIYLIPFQA